VISGAKSYTGIKVAVLTNGSLLWRGEVRTKLMGADLVMPTLSTAFEETFRAIHRPHADLHLPMIIEGMKHLRAEYRGELFLEVMLLAGLNDSVTEIEGLKRVIERICPDRIQLNTVVRPPVDSRAMPLDRERLEEIKNFFGSKAEIIAAIPPGQRPQQVEPSDNAIKDMARRRPVRASDIANGLNLPMKEVEELLRGLVLRGLLRQREHLGEIYYSEAE
jgi:wyosine [tRNA(Phe)-imidazoG37] synthetase (radical SAM superfamily)